MAKSHNDMQINAKSTANREKSAILADFSLRYVISTIGFVGTSASGHR